MPNKTLSIPDRDLPLWERGERAVKAQRLGSMSALVLNALSAYLGEDEMDTITVRLGYEVVRFSGRWLTNPDLESDRDVLHDDDDPAFGDSEVSPDPRQWRAGIAETARGRVAVYLHHWNYERSTQEELRDFDTLAEAAKELASDPRIPQERWTEARRKLDRGDASASWRDI